MLGSVPTAPKKLEDYRSLVGDERVAEILALAAPLQGARVLQINATSFGGGVAEILMALVPLMNDIGLSADWQVIRGTDEFYGVTKAMHNSLQGMYMDWTPQMRDVWLRHNEENSHQFDDAYDYVIVHDPQPAPLREMVRQIRPDCSGGKWIWRCHIDLTDSQVNVWEMLAPFVHEYDAAVFTLPDYVKDAIEGPQIFVVPPAIDPLSPKNVGLPKDTLHNILRRYGMDHRRPFVSQVSRFDPWKDPLGVIDAYRLAKARVSGLQLVLIASMAHDDPEAWAWYERILRRAGEDEDIHVLSNLNGVGNVEVNAFQRADVVIQKSVREGFGLVVSEGLWKGRPVVAGKVGGIPLQLIDGETGYLVSTTEECAERICGLIEDRPLAASMGVAGREHVREHFLITRYLRDYLQMFRTLAGITAPLAEQVPTAEGIER
jgi:trehalose synthase